MRKDDSLVSVVVPTFNRPELLRSTVSSILGQTYERLELIIVDNYSDYHFSEYLEEFKDLRIRGFQHANHGIIAVNRNYGIQRAKGEWIAFCDDDDVWDKNKLKKQIDLLTESDSDFCFTGVDIIDVTGNKLGSSNLKRYQRGLSASGLLFSFGYICNSSVVFKRAIVNRVGLLNEDCDLLAVEDYEFYYRIFSKYKPVCLPEPLVGYRIHNCQLNRASRVRWLRRQMHLNTYILRNHGPNNAIIVMKFIKIIIKFGLAVMRLQNL